MFSPAILGGARRHRLVPIQYGLIGDWNPTESLTEYDPNVKAIVGEPVTRVIDRSPVGNDLEQTDGNRQPLLDYFNGVDDANGYAWKFNGSNSMLVSVAGHGMTGDVEFTVLYAVRHRVSASTSGLNYASFGLGASNWLQWRGLYFHQVPASGGSLEQTYIGSTVRLSPNLSMGENPYVIGFLKSPVEGEPVGTRGSAMVNRTPSALATGASGVVPVWNPADKFILGNYHSGVPTNPMDGWIGRVLAWNRRLTDHEIALMAMRMIQVYKP